MPVYQFGSFVLDVRERRLLRNDHPIPLTPKVFDTLVYLVEHVGHLVTKDELMEAIWGGSFVEDANLPRTIHVLRRALGTGGDAPDRYIQTVPTKGYRFVGPVTRVSAESTIARAAAHSPPDVTGIRSWRRAVLAIPAVLVVVLVGSAWLAGGEDDPAVRSTPPARGPSTESGAAYARFLAGRMYLERHLPGDMDKALQEFEAAIQLDPAFAAAYAGKADAKFFGFFDSGAHDDIAQARLAVRKAIELDPDSAYAHTVSCRMLATYDWQFAEAEASCRRAVALNPRDHEARRELAFVMQSLSRPQEALKEMDAAIALAPTSFNKRSRGLLLYLNRRFDEAVEQLERVERGDPEYRESSRWLSRALEQKGDYARALDAFLRFSESAGARPEERAAFRRAFETGGWPAVLQATLGSGAPSATLQTAGTLAQLGRVDAAFAVLTAAVSARKVMVVHMTSEPRLDPLRSDPRYEQLLRRIGLRSASAMNPR